MDIFCNFNTFSIQFLKISFIKFAIETKLINCTPKTALRDILLSTVIMMMQHFLLASCCKCHYTAGQNTLPGILVVSYDIFDIYGRCRWPLAGPIITFMNPARLFA